MKRRVAIFDIDGTLFRSSLLIELVDAMIAHDLFPKEARQMYDRAYVNWVHRRDSYEKYITGVVRAFERHLKGVANHHRIAILLLIADREGITLEHIVRELTANEKTIGEHTRRLVNAGLADKKYHGHFVEHSLSPYGKTFVRFLQSFQRI